VTKFGRQQAAALEEKVLRHIRLEHLVSAGQRLLLGVSGGPDSVCLAMVLCHLRAGLEIDLHLAHLNHRLRGKEAEADAEYVSALALRLGLPCSVEARDVRAYQKERRISLEEAAREVRYQFLGETARRVKARRVAVGHNQNDQVETVLMHVLRGSGTGGLVGLRSRQLIQTGGKALELIRPLLVLTRGEIEAYCEYHRLAPRQDSSNRDRRLLRNRVRGELLPLLESYNPAIARSILRLSRIAGEDQQHLESEAAKIWPGVASQVDGAVKFDRAKLAALDRPMQRQVLRRAVLLLTGTLKDIEDRHVEEMLLVLAKPAGRQLDLPYGLVFSLGYDNYRLGLPEPRPSPAPGLEKGFALQIPGVTRVPGWILEAEIRPASGISAELNRDPLRAHFDAGKIGRQISFRNARRGEAFQPLGLKSLKKVAAFLLDARVPRSERRRIPVLANPEAIIWLAGQRIDERFKVTSQTESVLTLRLRKLD
jgi:tRNA(Ile)-lysidine synthase